MVVTKNQDVSTDVSNRKANMNNGENQHNSRKYTLILIGGSILFIASGILNFVDGFLKGWSISSPVIGYILFAFTACSLIPIAYGINKIAKHFFTFQTKKAGKMASLWLFSYGIAIAVNLIFYGMYLITTIVMVLIIFARVLGFYYIKKTFDKIAFYTNLKINGWTYFLYGIYSLVVSLLGGLSSLANDTLMTNLIFAFNGVIESIFIVIVGVKLILDFYRVNKFIKTGKIYRRKKSEKLEKSSKQAPRFKSLEEIRNNKADASFDYQSIDKELKKKETRNRLSNFRLIIGVCTILVFLMIYSYITANNALGVFSTVIFTTILTYVISLLGIKALQKKELVMNPKLTNCAMILLVLPLILITLNFGILEGLSFFLEFSLSMEILLIIILALILETMILKEIMRSRLNPYNFTFTEFLGFVFQKEKRNNTVLFAKDNYRKVDENFQNLDIIAAKIENKQKERSINIEDFDWKEHVNKI